MKTLLQWSCWIFGSWMAAGLALLIIQHQMTVWTWIVGPWMVLQSAGTLVYIHQHTKRDQAQARAAEHERIKAEVLAELN